VRARGSSCGWETELVGRPAGRPRARLPGKRRPPSAEGSGERFAPKEPRALVRAPLYPSHYWHSAYEHWWCARRGSRCYVVGARALIGGHSMHAIMPGFGGSAKGLLPCIIADRRQTVELKHRKLSLLVLLMSDHPPRLVKYL
jgi:hypothetical protein